MRYKFTENDLKNWDFCSDDDGEIVMHHLREKNKLEYSKNKLDNKGKVFIFINNKPQHIADIQPK